MSPAFDPDAAAQPGSGIFGLSTPPEEARVHILPVPFDATSSYRRGSSRAPEAILGASHQVELYDPVFERPYEAGIATLPADPRVVALNAAACRLADPILERAGELGGDAGLEAQLAKVGEIGGEVNELVYGAARTSLAAGHLPVVLGGDHSVPFGAIRAASEEHPGLGILHFDAHADLRVAFEGFEWSHASIMSNVLTHLPGVARLLSVGLRDFGQGELAFIEESGGRVLALYDHVWSAARLEGRSLRELVRAQLEALPEKLWISFDIDGLDPGLCPHTGTPVPGGLTWAEARLWLEEVARSGREVVGLDLCEVSPGEVAEGEVDSWDAIVGARLLYAEIGAALAGR